jgi:hypothetical protein
VLCNPSINEWEGVFAAIPEVHQPDKVIDPGDLISHLTRVYTQFSGNLKDVPIPMAKPYNVRSRVFASEICYPRHDRVCHDDIPSLGANFLNVEKDRFHQLQLVEVDPESFVVHDMETPPEPVAVTLGYIPAFAPVVMGFMKGGIDNELCAIQRSAPIGRPLKPKVGAELAGIAPAQLIDPFQALLIDIHEDHGTTA